MLDMVDGLNKPRSMSSPNDLSSNSDSSGEFVLSERELAFRKRRQLLDAMKRKRRDVIDKKPASVDAI
jgi:hypothetical protein